MSRRLPAESRTKAALCHLSTLSVFGAVVIPFIIGNLPTSSPEFVDYHRSRAIRYQLVGTFLLLAGFMLRKLPSYYWDEVSAGLFLAFYWVAYLCFAGIYFAGSTYLAFQAWSGLEVDSEFF